MYCLGTKDAKPEADERPSPPEETPAAKDDKPAYVQVLPAEVLLKPGDKQKFVARTFNERGQLLGTADAEFSLSGPGEIDEQGQYVADSAPAHTATIVKAKIGDITGEARIRVVPPLPYKFDFEDGQELVLAEFEEGVAFAFIELLEIEYVFIKRDRLFDVVHFNSDVIAAVNLNARPARIAHCFNFSKAFIISALRSRSSS